MEKQHYASFDPKKAAELALNYLTSMTDESRDFLPYWLVLPHKKPAEAAHCRVDDAELVGSWYEGITCSKRVLNTEEGSEVQAAFRRHLLRSWGEHGLRYHEPYPWSKRIYSSFHEMGYILSGLNRALEENPKDEEIENRSAELVKGLRSLVIERKVRTFWSGDYEEPEPVYLFPNDVYLRDKGFDQSCHTGRGEQSIRNGVLLLPLAVRYELTGDPNALDLAAGLANYILGASRYFNYKMEFFGHVHSAAWVATGLVKLGRLTGKSEYTERGRGVYRYIRSISSSFGWVPEYAQWHPASEEHCETCCIKDMIECAYELVKCGYEEYWEDINAFARNQLMENQVRSTGYMVTDNSLPDGNGITYRNLDRRIIGGYTGGSLPNSMSLTKFRSIAGCCCGMAPVALWIVWEHSFEETGGRLVVNIPVNKNLPQAELSMGYPDEGRMSVRLKEDADVAFRLYPWMGPEQNIRLFADGKEISVRREGNLVICRDAKKDSVISLSHPIFTEEKNETIRDTVFTVLWRGSDVVDILPHGEPMRLFQRDLSVPFEEPKPEDIAFTGAVNYGPTQQAHSK